jgi:hypothetical protein
MSQRSPSPNPAIMERLAEAITCCTSYQSGGSHDAFTAAAAASTPPVAAAEGGARGRGLAAHQQAVRGRSSTVEVAAEQVCCGAALAATASITSRLIGSLLGVKPHCVACTRTCCQRDQSIDKPALHALLMIK